jgi:LacI family transcriptional regulator
MDEFRPARLPTIKDVALVAGVSLGTASKALNGQGQLRAVTVERVRQAAASLNFRPNSMAQSLLRAESLTIGMISTDSFGRFSMPLMEGIEDVLGSAQRSVFMCNAADDPLREKMHVDALLSRRVDGIVVTGRRTDPRPPLDLGASVLPVVYAYTQVMPGAAATLPPSLLPDDFGGGSQATRHLLAQGRRQVAHITGPAKFEAVQLRAGGYAAALGEAGLAGTVRVLHGAWSEAWGREAVAQLFAAPGLPPGLPGARASPPDALFCGSDQIARGVLDGLNEQGLRVPGDVAVVGYDNWEVFADATRPTLTSVDMNLRELGRLAAQRLLDLIGGGPGSGPTGPVRLPTRLVVRESCGAHLGDVAAQAQAPGPSP